MSSCSRTASPSVLARRAPSAWRRSGSTTSTGSTPGSTASTPRRWTTSGTQSPREQRAVRHDRGRRCSVHQQPRRRARRRVPDALAPFDRLSASHDPRPRQREASQVPHRQEKGSQDRAPVEGRQAQARAVASLRQDRSPSEAPRRRERQDDRRASPDRQEARARKAPALDAPNAPTRDQQPGVVPSSPAAARSASTTVSAARTRTAGSVSSRSTTRRSMSRFPSPLARNATHSAARSTPGR